MTTAVPLMRLLSVPFDPGRARSVERPRWSGVVTASAVVAVLGAGLAMEAAHGDLRHIGQGIARGAVHAAFLVAGWIIAVSRQDCLGPVVRAAASLFVASIASTFSLWGALLYLLPPLMLLSEGVRREALRHVGLCATARLRSVVLGLGAGMFLGGHLLISASLTFGYLVSVSNVGQYLAAVAYDVGANALTAEWLFRAAIFSRAWRRWEFWPSAALSTSLAVTRYMADPALPHAIEARVGAVFYCALLGFTACALRAESGSILPGYLATVTFFAAYRMLVP
ncbi:MAG TPA: hypothetical protein VMS64_27550 [Candidatus Methylomirabilis sp.]|nr:hypothetical protein [Candidatus Methylomirabilis sp.]